MTAIALLQSSVASCCTRRVPYGLWMQWTSCHFHTWECCKTHKGGPWFWGMHCPLELADSWPDEVAGGRHYSFTAFSHLKSVLTCRPPSFFHTMTSGEKLKQEATVTRSIKKWSDEADAKLQDCFAIIDWNMFRDSSDSHVDQRRLLRTGICIWKVGMKNFEVFYSKTCLLICCSVSGWLALTEGW